MLYNTHVIFMKKLINKIELKPLLISVGLVLFQTVFFFLIKLFQSNFHTIGSTIDKNIPFNNLAIIPYCIWYILIFFVPYYLYIKDKNTLCKYIASYFLCVIISNIIFATYPTMVIRPDIKPNSILNFITWFIYKIDTPAVNCLPSLHCAVAMLFSLSAFDSKNLSIRYKIVISIFAIIIMLSTLFIKQHVFIDLVIGDILMTICYLIMKNNKYILNNIKKLLKI